MKPFILLLLFSFTSASFGQGLSESGLKKALKNAELENKNLPPKGWTSNIPGLSMEEMLTAAWKMKFTMEDKETPKYVYTFGNGSGNSTEEAFEKAKSKADEQLPGLMLLYFSTWNMASKISDDERGKIEEAINNAEKNIVKELAKHKIEPSVNMIREKGSKKEIHLRYYYPQLEYREYTRQVIMKELSNNTNWNEDKKKQLLTYEK